MTVRWGIIGAGMMGREHMRNIALLEDAEVVAVAEPDAEQAEMARAVAPGVAVHPDHRAMLAAGGLDAVVIAAPNHLHLPILRDVLPAPVAVLCEKPLGLSDAECAEIERLARGREGPVWVAMEYRYMPPVARLVEAVHAGAAGPVRMVSIREHRFPFLPKVGLWNRYVSQTGGTLVEKCCHFFDLMRLILQADPVRVYASGGLDVNRLEPGPDGRAADMIDNAFVTVDFENGARGMLDLCMFAEGAPWQEEVIATGPRARVEARVPGPARFAPGGVGGVAEFAVSPRDTKRPQVEAVEVAPEILAAGDHYGGAYFQHVAFARMLAGGGLPEVAVRDGRIAVAVGEAAEASSRTGRPIELSPPGRRAAVG